MKHLHEMVFDFEKALDQLKSGIKPEMSELERDGTIQRFEYTYELAWKAMKRFLNVNGINDIHSPKDTFKAAFLSNIIDEELVWIDILKNRNLTVHTYDGNLADIVVAKIPGFIKEFEKTLTYLKSKI